MSRHDIDIIERLRWDKRYTNGHVPVTLEDAAKEIERLRALALSTADRDAIREALNRNRDTLKAVIDGTTWGHEATTKLMQRVIEARDECTAALALIGEG